MWYLLVIYFEFFWYFRSLETRTGADNHFKSHLVVYKKDMNIINCMVTKSKI